MIPYRDDNPTRNFPVITVLLIVANSMAWIFFRLQGELTYQRAIFELGMIPYQVLNSVHLPFSVFMSQNFNYHGPLPSSPPQISPYLTVFTSMFMHGGFVHLAGNMLYLWIFGNNVEDYLGRIRFIIFYLICGLGAASTHLVFNPGSRIPTVGASGAISGILAAYLLLYPWARVYVLIPVFFFITTARVPAAFIILFWFAFQVLATMTTPQTGGGVAYWAHIGGFAAGLIWIVFRRIRHPPRRSYLRYRY